MQNQKITATKEANSLRLHLINKRKVRFYISSVCVCVSHNSFGLCPAWGARQKSELLFSQQCQTTVSPFPFSLAALGQAAMQLRAEFAGWLVGQEWILQPTCQERTGSMTLVLRVLLTDEWAVREFVLGVILHSRQHLINYRPLDLREETD